MDEIVIGGESFLPVKKLGKGSYGQVYKVEWKEEEYALKVIKNDPRHGIDSLRELDIVSRLNHPNLMKAELIAAEYIEKKKKGFTKVGILMDIADRDLWSAIHDEDLTYDDKLSILNQITQGLHFLHSSHYLHMDIKPLNILLTGKNAKLTDFGLALRMNGKGYVDYPLGLMTLDHRSINVLRGDRRYTVADDIWSLAITFFEVLTGRNLFSRLKKKNFDIKHVLKIIEDKLSGENIDLTLHKNLRGVQDQTKWVNLLKRMLEFDPEDRPNTNEILSSSLFKKFPRVEGTINPTPILSPTFCNELAYDGFDALVRISGRIPMKLETFFLASNIYQRSLAHRHPLTGNVKVDYDKTIYQAALSIYLAVKFNEAYFADVKKITELAKNRFDSNDLYIGEAALTNAWGGKFYPDNLFTVSTTTERLKEAFEVSRDCHLYRYLDVKKWGELNDEEMTVANVYEDKWGQFLPFLKITDYYGYIMSGNEDYIKEVYQMDRKND